jgi:RsiW-degrading membrane proteinase PrsW (M82 family)
MGFWIGLSKREIDPRTSAATRRKGFLAAVAIHGLYDFCLFSGSMLAFGAIAVLLVSTRLLRAYMRRAKAIDDTYAGIQRALHSP